MQSRFEIIRPYLREKILDIGFSVGPLNSNVRAAFPKTVSIDIIIKKAEYGVVKGDAEKMPFKSAVFGSILAGEVIEHVPHPEVFIKQCKSVLKKGGSIIITTPNRDSLINKLTKSYHAPAHISLFNKKELVSLLNKEGFSIQDYRVLPYTQESSEGSKHNWFYAIRKIAHHLTPKSMQEEMIIVARLL